MKKNKLLAILVLASVVFFACCKKDDSVSKTYTLNVTAINGTVIKNPDLAAYNGGAKVLLTATPNSDYKFSSWSGDTTSSSNPLSVTMNADINITANFTVIGVNVKSTGATGDGSTDDTKSIQTAIDQVAGTDGTVIVPAGTYMINALKSLNLKSNMTLRMDSGAVLKAITNNQVGYSIIAINSIRNVTVVGGTVQGERSTHTGTSGEWGWGIGIYDAQDVLIDGVTAKDCWGDGFYLGHTTGNKTINTNITLANVIADNNRRQGLSIVSGDSVIVRNSIFKNTNGVPPMAGIDVEPNDGRTVSNVQIINNEVMGNQLDGIQAYKMATSFITKLTISGNNVHNNGTQGKGTYAIELITVSGANISGNNVHNNIRGGILIYEFSMDNTITNNIVTDNGNPIDDYDYGIGLSSNSTGNTVTGNTVTGHIPKDIMDGGGNTISGNKTSN